ncbi:MAG: (2Fe-2S)-binding protein [Moraxellaceae bacterium]|nr:(2Fe-2S)-binding protein [Moraxellaceae bacterium]
MQKLCELNDIPDGDAIGVQTPGGEVVVVRQGRELHAYRNMCPHLGIELNFMPDVFLDTEHRYIQCANHGALFQIEDGLCVFGPCQGEALVRLDVQLIDNSVWLMPAHATKD